MYDLLFSADLLVPAPRQALAQLKRTIGLPQPGDGAYVTYPEEGWDVIFALVNKSFTLAPTRLEIIGPYDPPERKVPSIGRRIFDMQGARPAKTHATVLAMPDIGETIERVRRARARHWVQAPTEQTPFTRLWMGTTESDPADYRSEADAGLIVEVIPSNSAAFPPKLFTSPPPEPPDPQPGDMIRILSRAYLVDDLDAALTTLECHLGLAPEGPVVFEPEGGYRYAVLVRNLAHGAALKLMEATGVETPAGQFYKRWGAGPYTIRIAVHDLAAKAADLDARGTAFQSLPATGREPARLVLSPADTAGMPFELVEYGQASA